MEQKEKLTKRRLRRNIFQRLSRLSISSSFLGCKVLSIQERFDFAPFGDPHSDRREARRQSGTTTEAVGG